MRRRDRERGKKEKKKGRKRTKFSKMAADGIKQTKSKSRYQFIKWIINIVCFLIKTWERKVRSFVRSVGPVRFSCQNKFFISLLLDSCIYINIFKPLFQTISLPSPPHPSPLSPFYSFSLDETTLSPSSPRK